MSIAQSAITNMYVSPFHIQGRGGRAACCEVVGRSWCKTAASSKPISVSADIIAILTNVQVIEAKTPQAVLGVEGEDARKDSRYVISIYLTQTI